MTQDERWCTLDGRYVAQYCSPMDVARAIRLIDYSSEDLRIWEPSDSSIPSWDELIFRISAKENEIDTYLGMSWRCNRMVDQVVNLGTYWHDINGYRTVYPIPLAQGASFLPELSGKCAQMAAREAAAITCM